MNAAPTVRSPLERSPTKLERILLPRLEPNPLSLSFSHILYSQAFSTLRCCLGSAAPRELSSHAIKNFSEASGTQEEKKGEFRARRAQKIGQSVQNIITPVKQQM